MKRNKSFWKTLNKYERSYLVRYEKTNKHYYTFLGYRECPMCGYSTSCPPTCNCIEEYDRILSKAKGKMKDKKIVGYCMTCHKIRLPDGTWGVPELSLDNYTLSHGYCEPCGEKAIEEARAEIAKAKKIEWVIPTLSWAFRSDATFFYDKFEYGIGGGK